MADTDRKPLSELLPELYAAQLAHPSAHGLTQDPDTYRNILDAVDPSIEVTAAEVIVALREIDLLLVNIAPSDLTALHGEPTQKLVTSLQAAHQAASQTRTQAQPSQPKYWTNDDIKDQLSGVTLTANTEPALQAQRANIDDAVTVAVNAAVREASVSSPGNEIVLDHADVKAFADGALAALLRAQTKPLINERFDLRFFAAGFVADHAKLRKSGTDQVGPLTPAIKDEIKESITSSALNALKGTETFKTLAGIPADKEIEDAQAASNTVMQKLNTAYDKQRGEVERQTSQKRSIGEWAFDQGKKKSYVTMGAAIVGFFAGLWGMFKGPGKDKETGEAKEATMGTWARRVAGLGLAVGTGIVGVKAAQGWAKG